MLDFVVNSLMFHIILAGCISLASIFDKPSRSEGNIRNDIPSTIGIIVGCVMILYYLPLYSFIFGCVKLYLFQLYKIYQKNIQEAEAESKDD